MPDRNRNLLLAAAGLGAGLAAWRLYRRSREEEEELAGRTVLITGGSRGLGLELAREFGASGCRVALCARSPEELARARAELEQRGIPVFVTVCDVSDRMQVHQMVDDVVRHFGEIDILVNNAGAIQVGPVESMHTEDFERAMNVMFWGVLHPTFAVLPRMLHRRYGRMVNIASIGGKVSVPHLLPYNCAKFATVALSEGLNAELRGKGIRVTTIAPGLMRTGSWVTADFKGDSEAERDWFSFSASLPLLAIGTERAAREIVTAVRRGDSERVLSHPAQLLARVHGLFPAATSYLMHLANDLLLPEAGRTTESATRGTLQRVAEWLSRADREKFHQPTPA
jgi:NAD(P)-dependent dehydrogenase (short-subunit alcohol dehydrogenase family)